MKDVTRIVTDHYDDKGNLIAKDVWKPEVKEIVNPEDIKDIERPPLGVMPEKQGYSITQSVGDFSTKVTFNTFEEMLRWDELKIATPKTSK